LDRASTLLTLITYVQASMKNPGFIQGNTLYEVAVMRYYFLNYK
jgi:hypothetical protein